MWTHLSSFIDLEVLFSHSTLVTLPLNNEESKECGKNGDCRGFHIVSYMKPLKLGVLNQLFGGVTVMIFLISGNKAFPI